MSRCWASCPRAGRGGQCSNFLSPKLSSKPKNSELITPHPFHFEVVKVVLSLPSHFELFFSPSQRVNTTLIDIPPPIYFLQQTKKTSTKNKSTSLGNFQVQILSFFNACSVVSGLNYLFFWGVHFLGWPKKTQMCLSPGSRGSSTFLNGGSLFWMMIKPLPPKKWWWPWTSRLLFSGTWGGESSKKLLQQNPWKNIEFPSHTNEPLFFRKHHRRVAEIYLSMRNLYGEKPFCWKNSELLIKTTLSLSQFLTDQTFRNVYSYKLWNFTQNHARWAPTSYK